MSRGGDDFGLDGWLSALTIEVEAYHVFGEKWIFGGGKDVSRAEMDMYYC